MENIDRRSFVGAGAAALLGSMPLVALAQEAPASEEPAQDEQAIRVLTDDMAAYCERGGTSLTVEELNKIRHELVDAAGEVVKEDGTVIPAIWNKLNALVNTYGNGSCDPATGEGTAYLRYFFRDSEEDAQAYLDMPYGVVFSASDFAEESGRDLEECKAICEDFAQRRILYKFDHGAGAFYHQLPVAHGFFEHSIPELYSDPEFVGLTYMDWILAPTSRGLFNSGTPIYYSIPCKQEVVADERVLPLAYIDEILERHTKFAVVPCVCSLRENARLGGDVPAIDSDEFMEYTNEHCSHRMARCIGMGEEAEYYLSTGMGREITREECRAILQRNVDEGLVLQAGYVRNADIICSCHADCCGVLGTYYMAGPEVFWNSPISQNCSNYLLEYDIDSCIQCGACIARCPMFAIEMDETGHPAVTGCCVRCGQCGTVCPASARKLTARPVEERMPVPADHMDDHNRKFGYRVEHDLI